MRFRWGSPFTLKSGLAYEVSLMALFNVFVLYVKNEGSKPLGERLHHYFYGVVYQLR